MKLSDYDPSTEKPSLVDQDVFNLFHECLEASESGKVKSFSPEESLERMKLVADKARRDLDILRKRAWGYFSNG